jgi:hypothetical protein
VARVAVAPAAAADLERLFKTHSLPEDANARVRRSLAPLMEFPLLGAPLEGRWQGFRFILGPWRWMLIVYAYDEDSDTLAIVTIQDARSSGAVTTMR